jgi:hypothetical protein
MKHLCIALLDGSFDISRNRQTWHDFDYVFSDDFSHLEQFNDAAE